MVDVKHIHFLTLLLHILLLWLGAMLLEHYCNGFLIVAGILLAFHLIGCILQSAVYATGLIGTQGDPGSLGSCIALLFYLIAMFATVPIELLIARIKRERAIP